VAAGRGGKNALRRVPGSGGDVADRGHRDVRCGTGIGVDALRLVPLRGDVTGAGDADRAAGQLDADAVALGTAGGDVAGRDDHGRSRAGGFRENADRVCGGDVAGRGHLEVAGRGPGPDAIGLAGLRADVAGRADDDVAVDAVAG